MTDRPATEPRTDPDDILLALVSRLNKSPARIDEHFPDVLRIIADLRAEAAQEAAPRAEGLPRPEEAPVLLVTLARQYHGLAGHIVVGERGDHRDGSWINCPNHFCRMAQPYGHVTPLASSPSDDPEEAADG